MLRLTQARNKLLSASVCFAIVSMCATLGSLVGSLFGMNLFSGLEEEPNVFNYTTITVGVFVIIAPYVLIRCFLMDCGIKMTRSGY